MKLIEWPQYGVTLRLLTEQRDENGPLTFPFPATEIDLFAAGYVPRERAEQAEAKAREYAFRLTALERLYDRALIDLADAEGMGG